MKYYNMIALSDLHLGMKHVDHTMLLKFLENSSCNYLYLVGDIVDEWALRRYWYWPEINDKILLNIKKKMNNGTKVYWIAGNHDEFLREYYFTNHNFELCNSTIHTAINGKKYFIIHGDLFDSVILHSKWLSVFGSVVYELLFTLTLQLNKIRKKFKMSYWSLSHYLKHITKNFVGFLNSYEKCIIDKTKEQELDGVICGHIHFPKIEVIDNIKYINCGDGVESHTAIVETIRGRFTIIRYGKIYHDNNV